MMMTHQVALSDAAYQELTSRKASGESYSAVVLRLARGGTKDPLAWLRRLPKISKREGERWLKELEAERDAATEPA